MLLEKNNIVGYSNSTDLRIITNKPVFVMSNAHLADLAVSLVCSEEGIKRTQPKVWRCFIRGDAILEMEIRSLIG